MDGKRMLAAIQKGYEAFRCIVNKELHYIYIKNGEQEEIVLKVKKEHFMHLCGVKYKDPKTKKNVTARHFFELVGDSKIESGHLVAKPDGTTAQKLKVIGELKSLITADIRIIDGHVTFFNFSFEHGLRSKRQIFALAMIEERKDSVIYVPSSLLHLKTNKSHALKTSYEVYCIFERSRGQEDYIHYIKEDFKE